MDSLEEHLKKTKGNLTYEEILEILEAESFEDHTNPYKPLNFHDDNDEGC